MEDRDSDGGLPPGWTVELRVRKKGKRDKVVVGRSIAEGLPPGWIKKTRITKKGVIIRRDPYYIDPVSGYAFRSTKDANRYHESGEIRRNAFNTKENDSNGMELEAGNFSVESAGVPKKPKLSISKVRQPIIMDQSTNLNGKGNDQQIIKPAYASKSVPLSERTSILSQAEGYDQMEEIGSAESALAPGSGDEFVPQKTHETKMARNGQHKYKQKKETNLPRRASKRLAGIKVDPLPEPKTINRARRVPVKESSKEEAVTNENKSLGGLPNGVAKQFSALEGGSEKCNFDNSKNMVEIRKSGEGKHSYKNLSTPEQLPEKTVEKHKRDKNQDCFLYLPLEKQVTLKRRVRDIENGENDDIKLDYSHDLPVGEFLTDPCIAFAIQTLTGTTFETSKITQISSELNNSKHSENLAAAEGFNKKIEGQNVGDEKEGCHVISPAENHVIPKELAGDAEIDDKTNENSGSSSEMPLGVSWMDPCIEFAIKTLTDNIPLDYDPNTENCLWQQLGSSNTEGHCEIALSSVSLDNLCQTDYYCSQYWGMQKPVFKQPSSVDALPNTRNFGIGNSAGARLPQRDEDRRNGCQR